MYHSVKFHSNGRHSEQTSPRSLNRNNRTYICQTIQLFCFDQFKVLFVAPNLCLCPSFRFVRVFVLTLGWSVFRPCSESHSGPKAKKGRRRKRIDRLPILNPTVTHTVTRTWQKERTNNGLSTTTITTHNKTETNQLGQHPQQPTPPHTTHDHHPNIKNAPSRY